ncbi:MAG: LLM class flavin-dependent oxidoreductase [Steroidobacteraceae bacterium]|jgi:alkanesulfonate monooxygenase
MPSDLESVHIEFFSTAPSIDHDDAARYLIRVSDVARWSERAGCRGMLIYSDNSQADPWLIADTVIQSTRRLCPLVTVQPMYMHPYTVAKIVATLASVFGRRVYLNLIASGFVEDLRALGECTPEDRRYDRLVEYSQVILQLLCGEGPVTCNGEFYRVRELRLLPQCPAGLYPGLMMSGSSEASLKAAAAIGATTIHYPRPSHEYPEGPGERMRDCGIRVGIIARDVSHEAWEVAYSRFPRNRRGELTQQLAMKVCESVRHRQSSDLARGRPVHPYWLVPLQQYKTMCPYLVGSHAEVAGELARYITAGHRTFIIDAAETAEDLEHIRTAFEYARGKAGIRPAARRDERAGVAPA